MGEDNTWGYWLASPYDDSEEWNVDWNEYMGCNDCDLEHYALGPVIALKSDTVVKYNYTTQVWKVQ